MFARRGVLVPLVFSLVCFGFIGCDNSGLDSIQVSPSTQSLTVGQTAQLQAIGTYGSKSRHTTQDLTTGVTWGTSSASVATVNSSGMVTAVAIGTATITATTAAYNGPTTSSAIVTVSNPSTGSGSSGGNILSLAIIPSSIVFGSLTQSGQFLAIGTFSTAPTVRDLTNSVTWLTSAPNVFPVTNYSNSVTGTGTQNGGVVSAYGSSVGNVGATITAEATDSTGSIATATASVGCPFVLANPGSPPSPSNPNGVPPTPGTCNQNVTQLLSTLTVYNEGLNPNTPEQGGNWLVTAPSATCNPAVPATCTPVITCGPGAGVGKSVGLHGDLPLELHRNPDCARTERCQIRWVVLQLL
jgi:hypothetical protein